MLRSLPGTMTSWRPRRWRCDPRRQASTPRGPDQPGARGPPEVPAGVPVRGGRRREGWRVRRDPRTAGSAGPARVFDTLLDEQTILGLALGAGCRPAADPRDPVPGLRPQREDQLRGEAARCRSSPTASTGTRWSYGSPGYGYQKGFGGHFHNDNSVAVLRDIPGLVIACPRGPRRGADPAHLRGRGARRRARVRLPRADRALPDRDLHAGQRRLVAATRTGWAMPIGRARMYGASTDLTIVTSPTASG